jgi:hypothetical protein
LKTLYNRLEAYAKAGASVPGDQQGASGAGADNRAPVSAPLSSGPGYVQPGTLPNESAGMPHAG